MVTLYQYLVNFQSEAQVIQLDLVSGWNYLGLQLTQLPATAVLSLTASSLRVQLSDPGLVQGQVLLTEDRTVGNPLMITTTRQLGSHLTLSEPLESATFVGTAVNNAFTAPAQQLNLLMAINQSALAINLPGPDDLKPGANPQFFETQVEVVLEDAWDFDWLVQDALLRYNLQGAALNSSLTDLQLLPGRLHFSGGLSATLRLTAVCPQANLNIQASLIRGRVYLRTPLDQVVIEPGSPASQVLTLRNQP